MCHCAPVLSIHNTASKTHRVGIGLRPGRPSGMCSSGNDSGCAPTARLLAESSDIYSRSTPPSNFEIGSSPDASERIDLKQAIRVAKAQVADMLEGESYSQLGLEEVKYDDRNDEWLITLGLNHPWNIEKEARGSIAYGLPTSITRQLRSYKKIRIDGKTGRFISMEGHD